MRGRLDSLVSPHPLGRALPSAYRQDRLAHDLLGAIDDALAPIFCTLNNLDSYFDPWLTPDDFLAWLGRWVGALVDENWPVEQRRAFVAQSLQLHRRKGTTEGIRMHVRASFNCDVEVSDSGGTAWSREPNAPFPGASDAYLAVKVIPLKGAEIDPATADAVVAAVKPGHVRHSVEIVDSGDGRGDRLPAEAPRPRAARS